MILILANIVYGSIVGSDCQRPSHWHSDTAVCLLVAISQNPLLWLVWSRSQCEPGQIHVPAL